MNIATETHSTDADGSAGRWRQRVARFLLSGAAAGTTDFLLFTWLSRNAGWPLLACHLVSRPAGGTVSFTLNKLWTFGRRDARGTGRQALRYALLWGGTYLLSTALLALYRGVLPDHRSSDLLAKFAAEATTGVLSFLTQRFWVFR